MFPTLFFFAILLRLNRGAPHQSTHLELGDANYHPSPVVPHSVNSGLRVKRKVDIPETEFPSYQELEDLRADLKRAENDVRETTAALIKARQEQADGEQIQSLEKKLQEQKELVRKCTKEVYYGQKKYKKQIYHAKNQLIDEYAEP